MATEERGKEVVRRCIAVIWNQGDVGRAREFLHPNVRCHHARNPDADLYGLEAARASLADLRGRIPDSRLDVVLLFADGDRVMVYLSGQGTGSGGTALTFTATAIVRIAEGLIAEVWLITDTLGLLQQSGEVRRFA